MMDRIAAAVEDDPLYQSLIDASAAAAGRDHAGRHHGGGA